MLIGRVLLSVALLSGCNGEEVATTEVEGESVTSSDIQSIEFRLDRLEKAVAEKITGVDAVAASADPEAQIAIKEYREKQAREMFPTPDPLTL